MDEREKAIVEKFNLVQEEILKIGWKGVLDKYHPDINCEDPDAETTFKMYRQVYENIKKRLIV